MLEGGVGGGLLGLLVHDLCLVREDLRRPRLPESTIPRPLSQAFG